MMSPTGYTAAIGEGISFKGFILKCARAFGATIEMRDDPMDAPIPDEFKPSDYHPKNLKQSKDRLAVINAMTLDEADEAAQKEYAEAIKSMEEALAKDRDLEEKYRGMLREVEKWQPPTPEHQGLKDFMVQQITESIKFDCGYRREQPTLKAPQEWLTAQKESALRSIYYHKTEYAKDVERCKGRSEWVQALKKSLEGA